MLNADRERPRHPWLRPPDEMDDDCIVRPLRQTRELARMNGWTIEEADRLVAWRDGLGVGSNWTFREVQHLDFMRWLHEHGRANG